MREKYIFLLPYRDRELELQEWLSNMIPILDKQYKTENGNHNDEKDNKDKKDNKDNNNEKDKKDKKDNNNEKDDEDNSYDIIIINQCNNALFNKGACCNTGVKIINENYDIENLDITLIIHDVDIYIKKHDLILYRTKENEVKHPYGNLRPQFKGILCCIVICKLLDFIRIGGFPNYFGWGGEDVCLARRFLSNNIKINEDNFIHRRTTNLIIDPDSSPSIKKKKFNMICDKKNLKLCFSENHLNPQNGLMNIDYHVIKKYSVKNFEKYTNVHMYDIDFEIY